MSTSSSVAPTGSRMERAREVGSALFGLFGSHARARAGLGGGNENALAEELANSLESLGVTFVKLGQTLSTRRDLLPPAYIEALARLRGDVGRMSWEEVEAQVEAALGEPLTSVFEEFDREPVGSASVGQVHRGRLWDGREVAVKVQRPSARVQVEADLQLLQSLARQLDTLGALGERVHIGELVSTFATALLLELDYRVEAGNLLRVRDIVKGARHLTVPRPIRQFTRETLLVMQFVHGVPLSDVTEPIPHGEELAREVCKSYFEQILTEGFFHADPHPGNLVLAEDGRLWLIDLGMVESLDTREQSLIAQLVIGLAEGSPGEATEALVALCTALEDADPEGLHLEVTRAVRRSTAMSGIEATFGSTVFSLLSSCTEHGYRPPAQLATLARTLAMLDEVMTKLDATFDPATVVDANANQLAMDRLLGDFGSAFSKGHGLALSRLASRAPQRLGQILDQLATGRLEIKVDTIDEREALTSIRKIANRIAGAIIVAALLMAGAQLADAPGPEVANLSLQSMLLLTLGGFGAATLLLSILWFDR